MAQVGPTIHYVRSDEKRALLERAERLASEIEGLLVRAAELEADGYSIRLAEALTRSLIDQLAELRAPAPLSRRSK
jgi:hypothetical protein